MNTQMENDNLLFGTIDLKTVQHSEALRVTNVLGSYFFR